MTAPVVLAAAAVNASATAVAALARPPILLVCTGTSTSEDRLCAELIRRRLLGSPCDAASARAGILRCVDEHRRGWTRARSAEEDAALVADVTACAEVDRYDFAMPGTRQGDVVTLRRADGAR